MKNWGTDFSVPQFLLQITEQNTESSKNLIDEKIKKFYNKTNAVLWPAVAVPCGGVFARVNMPCLT